MGKTRPKNVVATAPQNLHNSTNRIRKPKTEAQIAKRARKNKQRREKRAVEKARANAKAETQKEPGQRTLMVESEARTARINSLRVSIAQRQEQIARRQAEIALKEAEIERLLAEEAVGRRSKQDEAEGDDADSVDDVDMEVDQ
ncbi:uncharacterized protein N7483_002276 [Penicillium malachiteum]|uniref:uncharacterized protein n=1 Tax=Penicillium malachiteum TaxID=1324776 RepID=UPI0025472829|nr:uncharacterized protein N7483_002276 [Penicillium malachiteum]KAJ5737151.1 hypothetical protein N7483_002276 [Penicillium malachiteum]